MKHLLAHYIVLLLSFLFHKLLSLVKWMSVNNNIIEKCKVCDQVIHPELDIGTTHQLACDWCGCLQCNNKSLTGKMNTFNLPQLPSYGYTTIVEEEFICDSCYDKVLVSILNTRLDNITLKEKKECQQKRKKNFFNEEPTTIWLPLENPHYVHIADSLTHKESY